MKPFGITAATLVFIAAAFVSGPQTAAAEESGNFRLLLSATTDYTTIDQADVKFIAGGLEGTMSVIRSSGEPFSEGADYLAECVVYGMVEKAAMDVRSDCTMTDDVGDSWFVQARRKAGDIEDGGGGGGRYQLLGGTGKFVGVSGDCSYETKYLPGNRLTTRTDCAWQK